MCFKFKYIANVSGVGKSRLLQCVIADIVFWSEMCRSNLYKKEDCILTPSHPHGLLSCALISSHKNKKCKGICPFFGDTFNNDNCSLVKYYDTLSKEESVFAREKILSILKKWEKDIYF